MSDYVTITKIKVDGNDAYSIKTNMDSKEDLSVFFNKFIKFHRRKDNGLLTVEETESQFGKIER